MSKIAMMASTCHSYEVTHSSLSHPLTSVTLLHQVCRIRNETQFCVASQTVKEPQRSAMCPDGQVPQKCKTCQNLRDNHTHGTRHTPIEAQFWTACRDVQDNH